VGPKRGQIYFLYSKRPYMDSPSLQAPFALAPVPTAHVYSASDYGIVSMRAMMGYSRAGSQSLFRAFRTWTLEGFSSAGSTGLPSFRLLRNRGLRLLSRKILPIFGSGCGPLRLVVRAVAQHRPGHTRSFVGQCNCGHI